MESVARTPEVQPTWYLILKAQGRTMVWLAQVTGSTYPTVQMYRQGKTVPPKAWLDRVSEVLGERVA